MMDELLHGPDGYMCSLAPSVNDNVLVMRCKALCLWKTLTSTPEAIALTPRLLLLIETILKLLILSLGCTFTCLHMCEEAPMLPSFSDYKAHRIIRHNTNEQPIFIPKAHRILRCINKGETIVGWFQRQAYPDPSRYYPGQPRCCFYYCSHVLLSTLNMKSASNACL